MARYWIRNRGRVQGPFTEERIQGLLRRGRFSRHFHVSEDRKNWYPAGEFPELFAGSGGPEPVDDESPFSPGGSPFDDGDDDDLPPVRTPTSDRKRKPASRRRPQRDEDDDDDYDDEDSSLEDDDEDWEDDEEFDGVVPALINWIERNVKVLVVVLLLVLGVMGWFFFLREDFTQDLADLAVLQEVQSKVMQAYSSGMRADQWNVMLESTQKDVGPMVARLELQASAMDMVKQELLFLARDDIPKMMKELPSGGQEAARRVQIRFGLIDQMIESKTRFHDGTALMAQPQAPTPQASPAEQMEPGDVEPGSEPSGTNSETGNSQSGTGVQPNGGFNPATTNQNQPIQ